MVSNKSRWQSVSKSGSKLHRLLGIRKILLKQLYDSGLRRERVELYSLFFTFMDRSRGFRASVRQPYWPSQDRFSSEFSSAKLKVAAALKDGEEKR